MDNPTEIGSDLIVASVAAIHDYGAPLLIVDMGTATTITAIDKDGVYTGGCICPGLKISLEALTGRTAQLPASAWTSRSAPSAKYARRHAQRHHVRCGGHARRPA